jgi:hypothetical protein
MLPALALLAWSTAALAADPPGPAAPTTTTPDLSVPAPAAAPGPALDFDLLERATPGEAGQDASLAARVSRRRTMLRLHQGLGLASWASLAATAVVGQLDFDDRFRGGGDTGRWHPAHRVLAVGSSALFAGAGLLALLAPEPYAKRSGRLDTATLHKIAMGTATAGMLAQVVLGLSARRAAGGTRERSLASAHQAVGYATLGAMTVGALVLLF